MAEGSITNIPEGGEIKGTVTFGQAMRIDGDFEGELITDNGDLVVGKTGSVKANIRVRRAIIEGRVDGDIKASDKVEIRQKAQINGNLQAKELVVEEGVIFTGKCKVYP
ncbi:MAG: bactofilin family protein [Planctomycetota bacterium]|jgi:cytoskeletal protein CcmA (bactofilin family)